MSTSARNPNFWYTDSSGKDHYYDDSGAKGKTVSAAPTPAKTVAAPKVTTKPTTPAPSTAKYSVQSTPEQSNGLSPGNYIQNGQIFNSNGMVVGNAPNAPTTQGVDPNYNPGFFGWLWDGVTHPTQALNAFENNTLTPAANAIGNTLKPVTDTLNNIINNGGAAGAAAGAVLGTGVGVSSNGGVHQGMGAPAPTPGTQNTDAMVDQATAEQRAKAGNYLPVNPTGWYNGQGGTQLGSASPFANQAPAWHAPMANPTSTASGTAPTSGGAPTDPTTPASGNGGNYNLGLPGLIGAGATLAGGLLNAGGSLIASNQQATAAGEAAKLQSDQFDKWLAFQQAQAKQQQDNITPWLTAGGKALTGLENFNTDNPAFSFSTTGPNADPSYTFRLNEGMKALQNSAAARGGLLSGNTLKGITNYGQEAASQEYNNAFNRYQTERNTNLNRLQSLAGLGQTAVSQANQVSQNNVSGALTGMMGSANALAQGRTDAANANASGYKGATNALTDALGAAVRGQRQDSYINALGGY